MNHRFFELFWLKLFRKRQIIKAPKPDRASKRHLIFLLLVVTLSTTFSQNTTIKCVTNYPLSERCPSMEYTITNDKILIINTCKNRKIYSRKNRDKAALSSLNSFIKNNNILSLDTLYSLNKIILDAGSMAFFISVDGINKEILIVDCFQQTMDNLIDLLNTFFPEKYKLFRSKRPCNCSYPSDPCIFEDKKD